MRAAFAVALGLDGAVEFMHQLQAGQHELHARGLGEGDLHIFDEMIDHESRREVALQDARREIIERPATGGAGANGLEHGVEVEAGPGAVEQALAYADHGAGDDDLVAHLGVLTRARAVLMDDGFAEDLEQGQYAPDGIRVATDHDREGRVARADVTAGHRGVDGIDALRLGGGVNLFRQTRVGGGHVDNDAAGLDPGEHAIVAEVDFAHIARVTDHGEDDVRLHGDGAGRISPRCALVEERLGFGAGAVVNGDGVAFFREMSAHGQPHDPGANPAEACGGGGDRCCGGARHGPAR